MSKKPPSKSVFDGGSRGKSTHKFLPSEYVFAKSKKHALWDQSERHKKGIEQLALNIVRFGLIEPIVVNPDGNQPVIAEGRRRVLAGLLIEKWIATSDPRAGNLTEIYFECVTKKGNDAELMGIMVSANEHRLDNTPMTRARYAVRMENAGASEEDIAIAFGKDKNTIKRWLRLGNASDAVQNAVDSGQISADAALGLAELSRDEQPEMLERLVAEAQARGPSAPSEGDGAETPSSAAGTNGTSNGAGRRGRTPTARDVKQAVKPNAIVKPQAREVHKVIAQLEADVKAKPKDRYFEVEDALDFAIALTKWQAGKVKAARIKGLTALLGGKE